MAGSGRHAGLGPQCTAAHGRYAHCKLDEAEKTVMDAYNAFDPRMGDIAAPFFSKGWIDAAVKPGKAPGAFAHPTVTDVHPYVMLNYLGKPRDVMTWPTSWATACIRCWPPIRARCCRQRR